MSSADLYRSSFGAEPEGVFSSPGRVNLIGEHTDYNNGLVLPFAIDARAEVAAGRRSDDQVRVVSAQRPGTPRSFTLSEIVPGSEAANGWPGYLFGMVWALADAGHPVGGFDLSLSSSVPAGAGLSSSAAVECAVGLAVSTLMGVELDHAELARIAQRAENEFVGVPCGLMDQMASATCRAGSLLFFDVGAGTTEHIPFDAAAHSLQVLVIDTRTHHSLADGEYAKRRSSCEQAAARLGVASLSDVDVAELDSALGKLSDDELIRRARHIITENARVRSVVAALRAGQVRSIGADLTASHLSLRDDYEVSSTELDAAVEAALSAGALGARMTGGGFGGSAIALVPADQVEVVSAAVIEAFAAQGFRSPVIRPVTAAEGARRDR